MEYHENRESPFRRTARCDLYTLLVKFLHVEYVHLMTTNEFTFFEELVDGNPFVSPPSSSVPK